MKLLTIRLLVRHLKGILDALEREADEKCKLEIEKEHKNQKSD